MTLNPRIYVAKAIDYLNQYKNTGIELKDMTETNSSLRVILRFKESRVLYSNTYDFSFSWFDPKYTPRIFDVHTSTYNDLSKANIPEDTSDTNKIILRIAYYLWLQYLKNFK